MKKILFVVTLNTSYMSKTKIKTKYKNHQSKVFSKMKTEIKVNSLL